MAKKRSTIKTVGILELFSLVDKFHGVHGDKLRSRAETDYSVNESDMEDVLCVD